MSFSDTVPAQRTRNRDSRKDSKDKSKEGYLSSSLARLVLLGLVVVTPWTLGGVFASVQVKLFTAVLVALFCWLSALARERQHRLCFPLLILPLAGGLVLGLAQLRPLPAGIYRILSPTGAQVRSGFVGADLFPEAKTLVAASRISGTGVRFPISLDPASTRRELSLLVLACAVFVLGVRYFKTKGALLVLCWVAAVTGAAVSFFGMVQSLTWNGRLFWSIPLTSGGSPFGPFVNRNNGGGFLTLCLAGAVALLVWTITRAAATQNQAGLGPFEESLGKSLSWRDRAREFVANLDAPQVGALVLTGCIVAGVLCSLSRGAFLAMGSGALVTVLASSVVHRKLTAVWVLAAGGLFAFAVVSWVGMTQTVSTRLATIVDQDRPEARLPLWRGTLRAAGDYWLLGSGFGTYRHVYGAYQQQDDRKLHDHAENQPLEALVTGGIPGLALLISAVVLAAVSVIRLLRFEASKPSQAFALMGIFALSSQVIHGLFDFGLYIPSNLLLFSLLMGAVSGRAALLGTQRRAPLAVALPRFKKLPVTPLVVIVLLCGVLFGRMETSRAAAVEAVTRASGRAKGPSGMSASKVKVATEQLAAALKKRPDDADAHLRLAEFYIRLFRLRAVDVIQAEQEAQGVEVDPQEIWPYTSTAQLHSQAHRLKEDSEALDALRSRILLQNDLRLALEHLIEARDASPLLVRAYVRLAELCFLIDNPEVDTVHLSCARRLAAGDAGLLFHLGVLHLSAGRKSLAMANWQDCLRLTDDFDERILETAMNSRQVSPEELIEEVLPASPKRLARLAGTKQVRTDSPEHRLLVARAEASMQGAEMPEAEWFFLQGRLSAMRDDREAAVESYKKAVALDRRNAGWHYELARTLDRLGRFEEAQEFAEDCVRLERSVPKYEKLLSEIVRHRYSQ